MTDHNAEPDEPLEAINFVPGMPWPWPEGERFLAQDGFGWHPDHGNMLLLVWSGITDQMVKEFNQPCEMALLAHGPLVGLLVRFGGGWEWSETMAWRTGEDGVPGFLRDVPADGHAAFNAILVDRSTRIVRSTKYFTVSPHFTKMLAREVADRWVPPVTDEEGLRAREEWAQKHRTINSALRASLARSKGGD